MLDFNPTLTDLAGLPHYARNEVTSLRTRLERPSAAWSRPALTQVRGGRSVRTEQWRYTEWDAGKLGAELYNLRRDPSQRINLAKDPRHAATVARLRAMLPAGPVEARPQPIARTPRTADEGSGERLKICETLDPERSRAISKRR